MAQQPNLNIIKNITKKKKLSLMHVEGSQRGGHLHEVSLPLGATLCGYQDTLTLTGCHRGLVLNGGEGKGVLCQEVLQPKERTLKVSLLQDGHHLGHIADHCACISSLLQRKLHQNEVPHLRKNLKQRLNKTKISSCPNKNKIK